MDANAVRYVLNRDGLTLSKVVASEMNGPSINLKRQASSLPVQHHASEKSVRK